MTAKRCIFMAVAAGAAFSAFMLAQDNTQPPAGGRGAASAGSQQQRRTGFTQYTRPLASEDVRARGKALYETNCATACHAADLRGSANGTNLLRSENTLQDKKGERVAAAIAKHNPTINLPPDDSLAIAEYIHGIQATMGGQGSPPGRNPVGLKYEVLVGDAKAGAVYFDKACANCHSAVGDMKGIATKYPDPKTLQNAWVAGRGGGGGFGGRGGGGNLAVVTMPDGSKIEGSLVRQTDWLIVLTLADGSHKVIPRDNDVPKVEVKDPNEAHKKMVLALDDPENKNLHDVTAYLATLK